MNEYGEVAQSVSKAFRRELMKHEKDAHEAAMRIAQIYGMDDKMAEDMVKQVERYYHNAIRAKEQKIY